MIESAFGGLKLYPFLDFSESFSNYLRIEYKSCLLRQPFDLSTDFETRLKHWRIFFRGEDLLLEGPNQLLAVYPDEIRDIVTMFQNPLLINGSSLFIVTPDFPLEDLRQSTIGQFIRFDSKFFTISATGIIHEVYSLSYFNGPALIKQRLGVWSEKQRLIDFGGRPKNMWERRTNLHGVQLLTVVLPYQ